MGGGAKLFKEKVVGSARGTAWGVLVRGNKRHGKNLAPRLLNGSSTIKPTQPARNRLMWP